MMLKDAFCASQLELYFTIFSTHNILGGRGRDKRGVGVPWCPRWLSMALIPGAVCGVCYCNKKPSHQSTGALSPSFHWQLLDAAGLEQGAGRSCILFFKLQFNEAKGELWWSSCLGQYSQHSSPVTSTRGWSVSQLQLQDKLLLRFNYTFEAQQTGKSVVYVWHSRL